MSCNNLAGQGPCPSLWPLQMLRPLPWYGSLFCGQVGTKVEDDGIFSDQLQAPLVPGGLAGFILVTNQVVSEITV